MTHYICDLLREKGPFAEMVVAMMKKSNILCRKLQLVVTKHQCNCTDTNTEWKTVHYMYTTLHCRVHPTYTVHQNSSIEVLKNYNFSGPFSQNRSHYRKHDHARID